MTDVSWTVNTNTDGDVTVDYLEAPMPTLTRGHTARVTLGFAPGSSAYTTLVAYLDYAGAVATTQGIDGTPYYRELHTDTEELLVSFDPSGADQPSSIVGWWGVITGGTDRTTVQGGDPRIELETFVLAALSDHADRAAAKTAHKV